MMCQKCSGHADAYLCRDCSSELRENLLQVPWLADRLAETHTRQAKLSSGPTFAQRPASEDDEESPVPYDDRARDLYDELRTLCMRWVRDIVDQFNTEFWPRHAVPADFIGPLRPEVPARNLTRDEAIPGQWRMRPDYIATTTDLAEWLTDHYLDIVNTEDAALCAKEIGRVVSRCMNAINRRAQPVYRGPCPTVTGRGKRGGSVTCGFPLYARREELASVTVDGGRITCRQCGQTHEVRHLEQRLLHEVGTYLMPANQVFEVMRSLNEPIAKSTFYFWRSKGRLQARAWRHKGRVMDHQISDRDTPMFNIDDVRRARRETTAAEVARAGHAKRASTP